MHPNVFYLHAEQGKITICSVSSEVYSALVALLRGCSVPRKERTPHVVAAYRINMKELHHVEPTKWSTGGQNCN